MTRLFVLGPAILILTAGAARAQQPPAVDTRPYRGLFGGSVGDLEQSLTLNLALGGGYASNVFVDVDPVAAANQQLDPENSTFGNLTGRMTYALRRSHVGVNANLAASGRYYSDGLDDFVGFYSGDFSTSWEPRKSTRVMVSHSTTYQPFRTLTLLSGPTGVVNPFPAALDYLVDRSEYLSHTTAGSISQRFTRRAGMSFYYSRQSRGLGGTDTDFTSHGPTVAFDYLLARGLGARIGYGFTDATYKDSAGSDASTRWHTIDAGLNFNRALSLSRRATLSFATGSTMAKEANATHYWLTGNARFNYDIGRTWRASVGYARGVDFAEAVRGPVISDSIALNFGGMVNRRLRFDSGGRFSKGLEFGSATTSDGFDTASAWTGVTVGLTRYLGLTTTYSYYYHEFDPTAFLQPASFRALHRNSLSVDLNVWLPLVQRSRRPDAAR